MTKKVIAKGQDTAARLAYNSGKIDGDEYPCANMGKQATAKALKARGLLDVWWMASRLFAVRLTAKGRAHYLLLQNDEEGKAK